MCVFVYMCVGGWVWVSFFYSLISTVFKKTEAGGSQVNGIRTANQQKKGKGRTGGATTLETVPLRQQCSPCISSLDSQAQPVSVCSVQDGISARGSLKLCVTTATTTKQLPELDT